jgi:hypothetical protein
MAQEVGVLVEVILKVLASIQDRERGFIHLHHTEQNLVQDVNVAVLAESQGGNHDHDHNRKDHDEMRCHVQDIKKVLAQDSKATVVTEIVMKELANVLQDRGMHQELILQQQANVQAIQGVVKDLAVRIWLEVGLIYKTETIKIWQTIWRAFACLVGWEIPGKVLDQRRTLDTVVTRQQALIQAHLAEALVANS